MVENIQNQLKPVKSNQFVTVVQPEPSKGIQEKPNETEKPMRQFVAPNQKAAPKEEEPKKQDEQKQKPSNPAKPGTRQRIQTGES